MRRTVLAVLALGAAAAAAPAAAHAPGSGARAAASGPLVHLLIVGRTRVLAGPRRVRATATTVRASGRRCAVGAATPLAALAAAARGSGPSFAVRDFGSCSRQAADAGSLFVERIGRDRNRGRDGWTYKVGVRSGTTGAADPSGPFGTGRRLLGGDRVTWFWCVLSARGSCQRTLAVVPARRRIAPGAVLHVTVRGYDDFGRGVRVAGATVSLGTSTAVSGANGVASVRAPTRPGRLRLTASRARLVPAFPEEVRVG